MEPDNSVVLYTKYRPRKLDDIVGQNVVTRVLTNSFKSKNMHHAYIFCGKYGTGKTSTARILAAMMNCSNGPTLEPCGECKNCSDIFAGKSFDVKELDGASNRGIDDIRELRKDAYFAPSSSTKKIMILDECLGHNSRVDTENGLITISKIVSNKLNLNVKSYNKCTEKIEYKPIIGWFKNSPKIMYSLGFETRGRIWASEGHLVSTPSGWQKIKDLNIGDAVYREGVVLNNIQTQLVYGSLLGDASILKNRTYGNNVVGMGIAVRIKCVQGYKQKEYLMLKRKILGDLVRTEPAMDCSKTFAKYGCDKEIETWRFATLTNRCFSEIYEETTENRVKKVNNKWLSHLNWMGVAFWFCDDGYLASICLKRGQKSFYASFSTEGFTLDENNILKDWFIEKGIDNVGVFEEKKNGKIYYKLCFGKKGTKKLLDKIKIFIPECMKWKLKNYITECSFNYDEIDYTSQTGVIKEKITHKLRRHKEASYDIEVADNNNYFVSGTLVHNCHSLTSFAAEALLKLIEEPPPRLMFILCTTEPEGLKNTIHSRCITLPFRSISWHDIYTYLDKIAKSEGIEAGEDALKFIAKSAKGSIRDALQNLQIVSSYVGEGSIDIKEAEDALGGIDESYYFKLLDAIADDDVSSGWRIINNLVTCGKNAETIIRGLETYIRNLMMIPLCKDISSEMGFTDQEIKRYVYQGSKIKPVMANEILKVLVEVQNAIAVNLDPENSLCRFVIASIIAKKQLEKKTRKA